MNTFLQFFSRTTSKNLKIHHLIDLTSEKPVQLLFYSFTRTLQVFLANYGFALC